jgi:head-tail adaptor
MVKAGLLRDRVTFQRLVEGEVDDYGNVYTGWKNIAQGNRSADFRERTGKEKIAGGALLDVGLATMRCRSDSMTSAVTTADRVIARGYTWAIKGIAQIDAKDTQIEFTLERGVAS